jgi:hypothetical protein
MVSRAELAERRELRSLRLQSQRLVASTLASAADVARWMVAIQGQDFPGAKWSIGLRAGITELDVEHALAAGSLVRHWPMRGTLHLIAPEDLTWILGLTVPRQATWAAKRAADLDITARDLATAGRVAENLMAGRQCVRRDDLLAGWQAAGVSTAGQRAYHLIWNLGQNGLIVFGAPDGKHQTFALMSEWITEHRQLDREEALAEFAARYFRSHGPATVRDFAWWSSLTLSDARLGVAAATGLLEREFGGVAHYVDERLEPGASETLALPGFDEYVLGYQDRSPVLAAEFADRIVPGNNGIFLPTIVIDGSVLGTWKRTETAKMVRIEVTPFAPLSAKAGAAIARALGGYSRFLGKPVERVS